MNVLLSKSCVLYYYRKGRGSLRGRLRLRVIMVPMARKQNLYVADGATFGVGESTIIITTTNTVIITTTITITTSMAPAYQRCLRDDQGLGFESGRWCRWVVMVHLGCRWVLVMVMAMVVGLVIVMVILIHGTISRVNISIGTKTHLCIPTVCKPRCRFTISP